METARKDKQFWESKSIVFIFNILPDLTGELPYVEGSRKQRCHGPSNLK